MPDPQTPAKGLIQPTVGGDNNTWGGLLNTDLSLIDTALGGTLALSIPGSTTLTTTQVQNSGFEFSGTLSATAAIIWPSGTGGTGFNGLAVIQNTTTGGHSITCGYSTGSTVTVLNGETVAVWADGTSFFRLAQVGGGATVSNADLQNSSITIAGHTVALGGTQALAASDLTNGTTGSGNIVLATSPTIASPTVSGVVSSPLTPSVATNAALAASATTTYPNGVLRLGVNTLGDAPPMLFMPGNSAPTLNGGAGDVGSQVPSADGKSWNAKYPNGEGDARQWGCAGGSDVTSEIQNAINWAAANSTTIIFPEQASPYEVSSQITIGNGTSTTLSTVNNFAIKAVCTLVTQAEAGHNITPANFKWVGGSGVIPFVVLGPIWNVTVEGLSIDCNNTAATGIEFIHPVNCRFRDIEVTQWTNNYAFIWTAYATGPSELQIGSQHNIFEQLKSADPDYGQFGGGIIIGEPAGGTFDPAQSTFIECTFGWDGSTGSTASGITLQFVDALQFFGGISQPFDGHDGYALTIIPATGLLQFPQNIAFYNTEINGNIQWGVGWNPDASISFWPYLEGDFVPVTPPVGPNINAFAGITTFGQIFGVYQTQGMLNIQGALTVEYNAGASQATSITLNNTHGSGNLATAIQINEDGVAGWTLGNDTANDGAHNLALFDNKDSVVVWRSNGSGSVTFPNGTISFPDGSSWSSAGITGTVINSTFIGQTTPDIGRFTDVYSGDVNFAMRSYVTITGGPTSNTPTLTGGPLNGNPTKWLPYDDNGVTRYIPAW